MFSRHFKTFIRSVQLRKAENERLQRSTWSCKFKEKEAERERDETEEKKRNKFRIKRSLSFGYGTVSTLLEIPLLGIEARNRRRNCRARCREIYTTFWGILTCKSLSYYFNLPAYSLRSIILRIHRKSSIVNQNRWI